MPFDGRDFELTQPSFVRHYRYPDPVAAKPAKRELWWVAGILAGAVLATALLVYLLNKKDESAAAAQPIFDYSSNVTPPPTVAGSGTVTSVSTNTGVTGYGYGTWAPISPGRVVSVTVTSGNVYYASTSGDLSVPLVSISMPLPPRDHAIESILDQSQHIGNFIVPPPMSDETAMKWIAYARQNHYSIYPDDGTLTIDP